jgi:hypothetical protein
VRVGVLQQLRGGKMKLIVTILFVLLISGCGDATTEVKPDNIVVLDIPRELLPILDMELRQGTDNCKSSCMNKFRVHIGACDRFCECLATPNATIIDVNQCITDFANSVSAE